MYRDAARPSGFGAGDFSVVLARNDPDDLFQQIDIDMVQAECFADPQPRIVKQHDRERVTSQVAALD